MVTLIPKPLNETNLCPVDLVTCKEVGDNLPIVIELVLYPSALSSIRLPGFTLTLLTGVVPIKFPLTRSFALGNDFMKIYLAD